MTGRQLISSALRTIGAIGHDEVATFDVFENARDMLNMLLGSMSAEELMPSDFSQVVASLYATVPNYTVNAGDGFDSDSICVNQKPASGGSQSLTLNGTYVTSGVATLDVPRHVIITSTGDDSGRTFVVTGTSGYNDTVSETLTGPSSSTIRGVKQFKTVTSITIDGNATGRITVGTDFIINMRLPTKTVYAYIRDSDGADTPLMIVDRNRYDEIEDKDEAGVPTRLFYDRSSPSGEIFLHPVPAGGLSLDVEEGTTEYISNGDFASTDTDWTLESQWAVAGGKLVRTPGTGLGTDRVTNGSFDGSADNWTLGSLVFYNTNQVNVFTNSINRTLTYTTGLSGQSAGDTMRVTYTLKAHQPSGDGPLFPGSSKVYVKLGGVDGADRIAGGTYTDDILFGDGSFSVVIDGGGGTDYIKVGIDDIAVQEVGGGAAVGADTASQVTGDLATEFVAGETYRLTFTVSGYAAGSCTPSIGGTDGDAISADGDYSMDIVCGSGSSFILSASSAFSGSFDDISVFKITDETSTSGDAYDLHLDLWLPFVEITAANVDSAINLPGEYLLALRWNLAADLAPEYGTEVSPYVFARAKETRNVIKMLNGIVPKRFNSGTPVDMASGQPAANSN